MDANSGRWPPFGSRARKQGSRGGTPYTMLWSTSLFLLCCITTPSLYSSLLTFTTHEPAKAGGINRQSANLGVSEPFLSTKISPSLTSSVQSRGREQKMGRYLHLVRLLAENPITIEFPKFTLRGGEGIDYSAFDRLEVSEDVESDVDSSEEIELQKRKREAEEKREEAATHLAAARAHGKASKMDGDKMQIDGGAQELRVKEDGKGGMGAVAEDFDFEAVMAAHDRGEDTSEVCGKAGVTLACVPLAAATKRRPHMHKGRAVYYWEQNVDDVNIYIPLPKKAGAKDVQVEITPSHVTVAARGKKPYINGTLTLLVRRAPESTWLVSEGEVNIILAKAEKGKAWTCVFQGHDAISESEQSAVLQDIELEKLRTHMRPGTIINKDTDLKSGERVEDILQNAGMTKEQAREQADLVRKYQLDPGGDEDGWRATDPRREMYQ